MRVLLDTHVFLWYITAAAQLPDAFRVAIQDPQNEVFLSVASVWEAVVKHALGKLPLPEPPAIYLPRSREAHGIQSLPLLESVLSQLAGLPPYHRDPFDRILIAQALHSDLTLASVDSAFDVYAVKRLKR